ncbi:MAG: beta-N-acetylhexosaminidase [Verrucomicrobia bacterium]|jgi:hypothetical protein|nr:beta-N-acetylhexosaminidase [Verrucomicrobiota bacterium]
MLDVSRGRVPKLETLKQLATDLAGFKVNELQLYVEHTFAYRGHREVWRDWGALTGADLRKLDAHCRSVGIDLVPTQNSFGHLRYFLEHESLKPLAEIQEPYPSPDGTFLRYPSTLAPNHRGTLPFLRGLYDELLPNFSSSFFNVGCDETWDLGRGQSRTLCRRKGQGRVYLDFLLQIHREVRKRGKRMMFWGDIILKYPALIRHLPQDVIALNWGYEADHPFDHEARLFARAGIPFYVCPGTSTWQTMIGRNDNALANLARAARAGQRHGAIGYLITDWGDGGHPQPLAVSYPAYLAGAALAWCRRRFNARQLAPVLSRDVFCDPTHRAAVAVLRLGLAHRRFGCTEPNATPFGATLAAPPPGRRELFCRNGLKYYARLKAQSIRAAGEAVARERQRLKGSAPRTAAGRILVAELDLAARMAGESCRYLRWQQALAANQPAEARTLAAAGIRSLVRLQRDFVKYWPHRNKGTPAKCTPFLDWRLQDYRMGRLELGQGKALPV